MRFLFIAFLLLLFCNCVQSQQITSTAKEAKLSYRIIHSDYNTWGYDIYNGTRLFIHQPTIPAIPGNKGFLTKQAAEKVAKRIIEKLHKSESPPTITIDEMKKMGVIKK